MNMHVLCNITNKLLVQESQYCSFYYFYGSYFHRYRQKGAVSDYNLMTRQLTTTVLQSKRLDESNKTHMLSAGIFNTPLSYHTLISSQEVG